MKRKVPCSLCKGTGKVDEILKSILKDVRDVICPVCDGAGMVEKT